MLDALPRLALLEEFPADVQILVPPHKLRYQMERLRLLGLLGRCRWISEKHLLVQDYYFTSPVSMVGAYSPYTVDFLRSSFLPSATNTQTMPARFYLRRTGRYRNVAKEEEVLEFFRKAGWNVIDTTTLSFVEQIRLFAGAEAICLIHGSGAINAVWCPSGCKVIQLFADSLLDGDLEWICQCVNAEHHFEIFPSDHRQNAVVDLTRLRELFRSLHLL